MSVNFNLYYDTINTILDQKLSNNLYFKRLDASGKLIDRCFLEKLLRIIAHCFGFYKNVNAVKELKQQVIKQLIPHLELDAALENEEDRFEQFAVKVAAKVKSPKPILSELINTYPPLNTPNLPPALAIVPNSTSAKEEPKKPVLTTDEILLKAAKSGSFSVEETALLFQQMTLNITDWPERVLNVSRYDDQGYFIQTRFDGITQLLRECSKLKKVKIDKIEAEDESIIHAFVTTLTVSQEFAHITVECPLIPLRQCYDNGLYINKFSFTPYTIIDDKALPAVHYFRKYATTPELRDRLFAITCANTQAKGYIFVLNNLCSCLKALSIEHPEEAVALTFKYVFPFLDGSQHYSLPEALIKAFPSATYINLCKQLLEDEANKKYFFVVLQWIIKVENRPSLMPVVEMAIKTVDRSKLLEILHDSNIQEERAFYDKEKELDRIQEKRRLEVEKRRLELMDAEAFNCYLESNFPFPYPPDFEGVARFIHEMPFIKISRVLAYAGSKNPEYSNIQTIVNNLDSANLYRHELRAIGFLELIRDPSAENRNARMRAVLIGGFLDHLPSHLEALAQIADVDDFAEIFSFLHSVALDDTFLTFFRSIIKLDDTSKTVAAFVNYWNFVSRLTNEYHFQRHHPQNCFNQIPSMRTLNAVLSALWAEYSKVLEKTEKSVQQERLGEWLTALLMNTRIETWFDGIPTTRTVKPLLNRDQIHLILERHPWIIDHVYQEKLYEQITEDPASRVDAPTKPIGQFNGDDLENPLEQFDWDDLENPPQSTFQKNCTKWSTELRTHPKITEMMAVFPDKQRLPVALEDIVFDYSLLD